ncbi:MAG: hypothetical protein ACW98U_16440 [Candidatus Thorarchaeota archaeon]|jgi:hypothetical protein
MSKLGRSPRRVLTVVIALTTAGMVIVGMTIIFNPPTADIPEPSFDFASYSLDNMFHYLNTSQGGTSTNMAEFHISFDNIESGSAFLRLRSVAFTIWVRDIASVQANTLLMGVNELLTVVSFNPGRELDDISVQSSNLIEGAWWATGVCTINARNNELLTDMAANLEYGFSVSNDIANEYEGHTFLVKIQADVTYNAFYLGGISNTHYQDATYNWTLGQEFPIYMLPYDSP